MCGYGYVTGFLKLFISNQIDWAFLLVSGCQVFSEDLNSNTVSKLLILVWSYEGMKVMNFSYWKSYEYFSLLQYVTFPAGFHNAQATKWLFPACDRNADLHNYREPFIWTLYPMLKITQKSPNAKNHLNGHNSESGQNFQNKNTLSWIIYFTPGAHL